MNARILRDPTFRHIASQFASAPHDAATRGVLADYVADLYDGDPDHPHADMIRRALPIHSMVHTEHGSQFDPFLDVGGGTTGFISPDGPHNLIGNYIPGRHNERDEPIATHTYGPETHDLFYAPHISDVKSGNFPIDHYGLRYTLRLPGKTLRTVTPMSREKLADFIHTNDLADRPEWKAHLPYKLMRPQSLNDPRFWTLAHGLTTDPHDERTAARMADLLHDSPIRAAFFRSASVEPKQGRYLRSKAIASGDLPTGETLGLHRLGDIYAVHYHLHHGAANVHRLRAVSPDEARQVAATLPPHAQAAWHEAMAPKKLARLKAPAGGAIVNNQFVSGGRFIPRVFARLRDVAAALSKRADDRTSVRRTPASRLHRDLVERLPGVVPVQEQRLTLHGLHNIEQQFALPDDKKLSPHVTPQGEHFTAPVEHIAKFFESLVHSQLPTDKTTKLLRDPKNSDPEKLQYLITHLGHELRSLRGQSGNGITDWYGKHIDTLDAGIHRTFAKSPSDPLFGTLDSSGQLIGKDAAPAHHPGTVLFKALIAAMSAGQKPTENLKAAVKAWRAGESKAAGHDPILNIPRHNEPALNEWRAANPSIPEPPAGLHAKGKWYAEHVRAGEPGYASFAAKILHRPDKPELHGLVVGMAASDMAKLSPDERDRVKANARIAAGMVKRGTATVRSADLPLGSTGFQPKGWSVRKEGVSNKIGQLQALVAHFSGRGRTRLEAWRDAAAWLLDRHPLEEFDRLSKATRGVLPTAAYVKSNTTALEPDEKIPGAFVLGKKFGPFMLNLHMNHESTREGNGSYLTADKWFSRTMNRYVARLFADKVKPSPKSLRESPTPHESRLWAKAMKHVAKKLGVSVAELQADLWFHEQNLYRMYGGQGMPSYNFADAVKKLRLSRTQAEAIDRLGALRASRGLTVPLHSLIRELTALMSAGRPSVSHPARARLARRLPTRDTGLKALMQAAIDAEDKHPTSIGDTTPHAVLADYIREAVNNPDDPRALAVQLYGEQKGNYVAAGEALGTLDRPQPFGPSIAFKSGARLPNGLALGSLKKHKSDVEEPYLNWFVKKPDAKPTGRLNRAHMHTFTATLTPEQLHTILPHIPEPQRKIWADYAASKGWHKPVEAPSENAYTAEDFKPFGAEKLSRSQPTAYAFVSPNRAKYESIADAAADLPSVSTLVEHARYLPGVQRTIPAVGVGDGGAEPSVIIHGDPGSIASIAEALGNKYDQDAVLHFTPGHGADALHRFKSADAPEKIHADLSALGIENKTIVPGGATYVVDLGDESREKLAQYASARGAEHDVTPGHAVLRFLRGEKAKLARSDYAGLTRGELSAVRSLADRWTRRPGLATEWGALFDKAEPILAKLRGDLPASLSLHRGERGEPGEYDRHTAWSLSKGHAQDWMPGATTYTARAIPREHIALSLPHLNARLAKAGLKPVVDDQQEVIVKPHAPTKLSRAEHDVTPGHAVLRFLRPEKLARPSDTPSMLEQLRQHAQAAVNTDNPKKAGIHRTIADMLHARLTKAGVTAPHPSTFTRE